MTCAYCGIAVQMPRGSGTAGEAPPPDPWWLVLFGESALHKEVERRFRQEVEINNRLQQIQMNKELAELEAQAAKSNKTWLVIGAALVLAIITGLVAWLIL